MLIVVIGKRWLMSCDQEGKRQLENPEDFVLIEIATALKRDIRVIPVLVENASMPRSGDLPDDLKSLVRRQALAVSHDRFRADSERLIGTLERALEKENNLPPVINLATGPLSPRSHVRTFHFTQDRSHHRRKGSGSTCRG